MIRYHLTIEQVTDNDAYAEELKAWNEQRRYAGTVYQDVPSMPDPKRDRTIKVLSVTVTEVEFAAIKKAALAVMA